MFQASDGKFAAFCVLDNDVDPFANSLKEALLSTAEEFLGRQRKKIKPWVTNEGRSGSVRPETAAETTEVYNAEARLEYRLVTREVGKMVKEAKEE